MLDFHLFLRQVHNDVAHQTEIVTNAAESIGKGLKKSISNCRKEAHHTAQSLSDFVDVEDLMKSIHRVIHTKNKHVKQTSIIHTPIDWSKYPRSAFRKYSEDLSLTYKEEADHGLYEEDKDLKQSSVEHADLSSDYTTSNTVQLLDETEDIQRSRKSKSFICKSKDIVREERQRTKSLQSGMKNPKRSLDFNPHKNTKRLSLHSKQSKHERKPTSCQEFLQRNTADNAN